MSGPRPTADWYIARDGQQHGPVSDAEFSKLVEGGFLKPTDLVWREGFADWRSAQTLFPPVEARTAPPSEPPPQQAPYQPQQRGPEPYTERTRQTGAAIGGHAGGGYAGAMPQGGSPAAGYSSGPQGGYEPRSPPTEQQFDAGPTGGAPRGGQPHPLDREHGAPSRKGPMSIGVPGSVSGGRDASPSQYDLGDDEDDADEPRSGGGRLLKRAAVAVFFLSALSAAGWWAYPHRERIFSMATAVTSFGGSNSPDRALLETSPFKGFQVSVEGTDDVLQKALLWRTLKREFPEWYANRLKDAAQLTREKRSEADVGRDMAMSVMQLRRQHSGDALAATMPRLKVIASSFAENLQRLRKHSVDACYGYISSGEAHPVVVGLFQSPEHASNLQRQINAVFEAIAEGRKTPRVYAAPKQADYNLLVVELEGRGWTQADMQLFSDSKALAKAPPEKVCKMVQEWFEAQLAVKDADAQLRLIVDALRPVVAG
jgi:GYF domain 2